jgi:death on curing protein
VTEYLTVDDVLAFHAELIARYGGSLGLRDSGCLQAAILRPQSGYYGDVIAQAAALWESLSQNHPFVDGNKRVAFASTYTFLRVNGIELTADANETWTFVSGLYESNDFRFNQLDAWLRCHMRFIGD